MPPSLPKRERSASANALCHADEPRLKAALVQTEDTSSRALNDPTAPFMSPNPGESMYDFRIYATKVDPSSFLEFVCCRTAVIALTPFFRNVAGRAIFSAWVPNSMPPSSELPTPLTAMVCTSTSAP